MATEISVPPEADEDDEAETAKGGKRRIVPPELAAMLDIENMLKKLTGGAQRRVKAWLLDRLTAKEEE